MLPQEMRNDRCTAIHQSYMSLKSAERAFVVLVILSYAVFQRGLHESGAGLIQMMAFLLLAVVEVGTLFLFVRYNGQILTMVGRNRLLLLFTLLTMLSAAWSVHQWHTFFLSTHLLLTTLLVFYIAARFSLQEFIQMLAAALGILALISVIAVVLRPDAAIHHGLHEGNWRGIFFHKNGLGREMAVGAVVFLIAGQQKYLPRFLALAGLLLCTLLVIKTSSITAWIALATVLALYPFLRALRFQFSVKALIPIILLLSAGIIANYLVSSYAVVLEMLGKDVTLTNRVFVWAYSWANILQHPLLGYGYNAFWQDSQRALAALDWLAPHAHNSFLELLLDVGVIGTALLLFVMLRTLGRAVRSLFHGHSAAIWFVMVLVLLVLVGLADSGLHWPYNLLWLTFASSVCYLSKPREGVGVSLSAGVP
jgi:O-antigen ligase